MEEANTRIMRYLWIPPPQSKYLIINILNNTLMTHLTSFKNNLSKQRLISLKCPNTMGVNSLG